MEDLINALLREARDIVMQSDDHPVSDAILKLIEAVGLLEERRERSTVELRNNLNGAYRELDERTKGLILIGGAS